ncbi:hypothetical protein [Halobellus sp. GM3]|uniref:hypothetical protein n=1 Tax=Halobellus sp. GM3 TaxID=3458410 RepID=UPI00403DD1E7
MSRSIRGRGDAEAALDVVRCAPADVDPTDRVRDLDQLPPADQAAFLEAVEQPGRTPDLSSLTAGDVVRFSEYYRVV